MYRVIMFSINLYNWIEIWKRNWTWSIFKKKIKNDIFVYALYLFEFFFKLNSIRKVKCKYNSNCNSIKISVKTFSVTVKVLLVNSSLLWMVFNSSMERFLLELYNSKVNTSCSEHFSTVPMMFTIWKLYCI
jgi:hypothetical protein